MNHFVLGAKVHCLQYCLTVLGVFSSSCGASDSLSISGPLIPTLSRFQAPVGRVEWHLSFWKSWWKNSLLVYFKESNPGTCCLLPALSPLFPVLYLFTRGTEGTNKPFSLLFFSTFKVPQVANNVQLLSPWDGQGCTSECSLGGPSAGLQERANFWLGKQESLGHQENPEPSKPSCEQTIYIYL